MKILVEFFPILLFFLAYKFGDIYVATATAIIASFLQVFWLRYTKKRFEKQPLITLVTLVILGGATLVFRNELFIKWKPTALYWILALIFLITQFLGKKPLIQRLIEEHIQLPQKVWTNLNAAWVLFFLSMGIINLYIIYHFDTNAWVNFKLFGTLGLTLLFIVLQGIYLANRHQSTLKNKEGSWNNQKID